MNTSGWKFLCMGVVLLAGLAATHAQRMPQDSWVRSRSWGSSGSGEGQFNTTRGVAVGPDGRIYTTDFGNNRVQVFDSDGTFIRQWSGVSGPYAITVSPNGHVYVAENNGDRIHVFDSDGTSVLAWGSNGSGDGQFNNPKGVALAPDGRVWVVDSSNQRIQIFETNGTFVQKFGSYGSLPGQFNGPMAISFGPDGEAYVADLNNHRIQVFDGAGNFLRSWSHGSAPWDVKVSPDGLAFVANSGIQVYQKDGTPVHSWSITCAGVAIKPDGGIVVAGHNSNKILVYDRVYRVAGSGGEIPRPCVLSCEQRAGTPYLDIDYTILDADSPTVNVAVAAFDGGTNSLAKFVLVRTLLEGTEANLGTNVQANVTNRLTWDVAADWSADYVNLKVCVLANDGRGLIDVGFVTLPASGTNAALTLSTSPLTPEEFMPAWYWLLATGDAAVSLSTGKVYGVGGDYDGQVLAQGASTTEAGRAFLFDRLGVREASAAELEQARAGSAGVTNQWTPRVTVGPDDRPRAVNEYGFDTGDWGSDAWWVVKE